MSLGRIFQYQRPSEIRFDNHDDEFFAQIIWFYTCKSPDYEMRYARSLPYIEGRMHYHALPFEAMPNELLRVITDEINCKRDDPVCLRHMLRFSNMCMGMRGNDHIDQDTLRVLHTQLCFLAIKHVHMRRQAPIDLFHQLFREFVPPYSGKNLEAIVRLTDQMLVIENDKCVDLVHGILRNHIDHSSQA